MKYVAIKFISIEKELFFKIILLFVLVLLVFFNRKIRPNKVFSVKLTSAHRDIYGNFDQVHVPNNSPIIARMIAVLKPGFGKAKRNEVALKIHQALQKYKIEPQIMVAIIDTESNFNHHLVSSTGDISIAQVNVEVWNKEFVRLNLHPIEKQKLKADQLYSLEVMAQILHILKSRYAKKDRRWYARYHSKTKSHKKNYLAKLERRMKLLEKSNLVAFNNQ